jgi:hypothetical protein
VKERFGLIDNSWRRFTDEVTKLSQVRVSKPQAIEFFMDLMGYDNLDAQETLDSTYTIRKLLHTYETAPGQDLLTARGTGWGLVNAVTYFADHGRRARTQGSRLDSAWFGASARLKEKAFAQALELAAAA